ncbi:hypothetical protein AD998_10205 [bacterium 336/3]|nr:hypothetical protein AD998_10205 [bacterium 336/3]
MISRNNINSSKKKQEIFITAREKAKLSFMLMSGDIDNILLAFEMIINLREDLRWIIWRAKEKLKHLVIFFEDRETQIDNLIGQYQTDRIIIKVDMSKWDKIAEYHKKKLEDVRLKNNLFNIVFNANTSRLNTKYYF